MRECPDEPTLALLACPVCARGMNLKPDGALTCAEGHSFDRARAGYYNLLPVQHKASRDPGDDKAMVAARSRVLATGAFRPISDAIATQTIALLKLAGKRSCAVLDAGCGEGSYLHALASALAAHPELEARLAGIDISKWAIQSATKRAATATFLAVASNRHLPFRKEKLDVIVSLFGFPLWDAFAPTQPPCAHVLLVDPAPDHLKELRTIIYRNVRKTQPPRLDAALASGYRQADEQRITFSFDLEPATLIADLLTMTPHAHRATAEGRATLATKTRLALTGDVVMRTLVKSAA